MGKFGMKVGGKNPEFRTEVTRVGGSRAYPPCATVTWAYSQTSELSLSSSRKACVSNTGYTHLTILGKQRKGAGSRNAVLFPSRGNGKYLELPRGK